MNSIGSEDPAQLVLRERESPVGGHTIKVPDAVVPSWCYQLKSSTLFVMRRQAG